MITAAADALAVGLAIADGIVAAAGVDAGVLALIPATDGASAGSSALPARAAARRIASSLSLRDVTAVASGRLVIATLDGDPLQASAQAGRVDAAAGEAPVVIVISGPRAHALEVLLAAQDEAVAVIPSHAPDALATLVQCAGARIVRADVPALARAVAPSGLPVLGALRRLGREIGAGT